MPFAIRRTDEHFSSAVKNDRNEERKRQGIPKSGSTLSKIKKMCQGLNILRMRRTQEMERMEKSIYNKLVPHIHFTFRKKKRIF